MPIFVHLMRRSALAAAFATTLASCSANPAYAQENCVAKADLIFQAEEAVTAGAVIKRYEGSQATIALSVLLEAIGPAPRPLQVTEIVMLRGPAAAVLGLIEGDKACYTVAVSLDLAAKIVRAVEGAPA